jgi:general secretion pathway protein A
MYLSFFQLEEFPFSLTPDPRFLFMSRSHREAFDHLLYGIHQRRGFIEVVGGIGTGKTTLCRAILEELEGKVATALIFNTFLSEMELLRAINQEFGIDATGKTRKELIDVLNRFLIQQLTNGGNACLILDECQNLRVSVLEQIRMLSNLETNNEKLLQIVLVGQPEFHQLLKSQTLSQLDERIQVRSFLEPLTDEDTRTYIVHRITVAGSRGDIQFSDGALRVIYDYSQGNPRRINTLCDRCLLVAYAEGTFAITRKQAQRALEELQKERGAIRRPLPARTKRRSGPVGLQMVTLGLLGVLLGWQLGKDLLFKTPVSPESPGVQVVQKAPPQAVPFASAEEHRAQPRQWDLPGRGRLLPGLEDFTPPDRGTIQAAAAQAGLEAMRVTLTWDQLLRLRRSCVLETRTPADATRRYLIMRGVSRQGVWIEQDNEVIQLLSQSDLEGIWMGGVWLLIPPGKDLEMGVEHGRDAVLALQRALSQLGYWTGSYTGDYDKATIDAVMAFQKDLNLPASGDPDLRTRVLLSQLAGDVEGAL